MRMPDEEPDLKLVDKLIFAPKGLSLQRFSHAETVTGKTPDFRVFRGAELVAFCEVKSPRDDWLDNQLDSAPALKLVGGLRRDPTFNRIARHVEKAAAQFDAVNADLAVLNILVFVNHDKASHFGDLCETLTGVFQAEGGERFETMSYISEGRLAEPKKRIDLYVWLDGGKKRVQGYLFSEGVPARVIALCQLLGLDDSQIKD